MELVYRLLEHPLLLGAYGGGFHDWGRALGLIFCLLSR